MIACAFFSLSELEIISLLSVLFSTVSFVHPQATEEIPHGIRYSFTLHDRHGQRIMGFTMHMQLSQEKKVSIRVEKHMIIVIDTQKMKEFHMNL